MNHKGRSPHCRSFTKFMMARRCSSLLCASITTFNLAFSCHSFLSSVRLLSLLHSLGNNGMKILNEEPNKTQEQSEWGLVGFVHCVHFILFVHSIHTVHLIIRRKNHREPVVPYERRWVRDGERWRSEWWYCFSFLFSLFVPCIHFTSFTWFSHFMNAGERAKRGRRRTAVDWE